MNDPKTMNNPCFTTEEWLDAVEAGDVVDIAEVDVEEEI